MIFKRNGGASAPPSSSIEELDVERVVFLSDIHVPHHDRKALAAVLSFIRWYQPHRIVLNGDVIDGYPISRFDKDPLRAESLQDECDICVDEVIVPVCAAAPEADVDFVPGNHELRLEKYLMSKAPGLAGLRCLRLDELLRLRELGVNAHDAYGFRLREHFRVYHGTVVRKHSAFTAHGEMEKWGYSTSGISGHTHRMGAFQYRTGDRVLRWFEQGHLSRPDPEYILGTPNWHQGLAVGEFERDGDWFDVHLVEVNDGVIRFGGHCFSSC